MHMQIHTHTQYKYTQYKNNHRKHTIQTHTTRCSRVILLWLVQMGCLIMCSLMKLLLLLQWHNARGNHHELQQRCVIRVGVYHGVWWYV